MNGIDDYPIHLAIRKYGKDNFIFEILEWTSDYDNEEIKLIALYNSLIPNGYNIREGGQSLVMYGEDNPRNKVPNNVVPLIIQELKENKLTDRAIATKYGLTDKIIADINHGYSHKQEGISYPIRIKRGSQKLTQEEAIEIKEILATSLMSYAEIAEKYGISKSSVYSINKGMTFKENREYPIRKVHRKN